MALKLGISFKDHERELYDFLKSQVSPSCWIKEAIKKAMESEEKPIQKANKKVREFDF